MWLKNSLGEYRNRIGGVFIVQSLLLSKILISAAWPVADASLDFPAEAAGAALFQEIVYRIRNVRGELNLPPDRKANVVFKTSSAPVLALIER